MRKLLVLTLSSALALGAVAVHLFRAQAPVRAATQTSAQLETRALSDAANQFLSSLTPEQKEKVRLPFTPQKAAVPAIFKGGMGNRVTMTGEQYGKAVWSNFPVSDVPRPGITLGSLTPAQREAAMHLLEVALSPQGYAKVLDIMGSDQAQADGGTNYASGKAYYTLAIFGSPDPSTPWMLEFGGHHLGLNLVVAGERGVITPTMTGAQPSVYTANGKTVRALAAENDKAFDLLHSFDDNQRKAATLNYRVPDLVLGPGHDCEVIQPEGLKGSAMSAKQRDMLLDLISEWAGIVKEPYAAPQIAAIKAGLNSTWFAWSGPTTHQPNQNGSAYYRIQGPNVIIEFAPQDSQGDPTLHVHTVYRDPQNEYGHPCPAETKPS